MYMRKIWISTEANFTGITSTMHINHFPALKLNFFHAVYSYSNLWMFLCYYQRPAVSYSSTCFFWFTFYGSHSLNLHRLVVARSDKSLARFAFLNANAAPLMSSYLTRSFLWIGDFCNVFKFHAYSVNKRLFLTAKLVRGLSDVATTNVCKVDTSNRNHIERSRWMKWLITGLRQEKYPLIWIHYE